MKINIKLGFGLYFFLMLIAQTQGNNLDDLPINYTEHCAACSNQTQTAPVYQNADSSPSKHEDLTRCCFNVGPAPLAVGQY